ncbi:hypothetical protein [Vibrio phage PH669]|uniref:Uncharacterized protein n=1 Tax=Vibrio phage PH669 TaxID=2800823 RepID=A0A7T7CLF2_9CAUD|nr:hypothetical protein [Vibrio phage PH669]
MSYVINIENRVEVRNWFKAQLGIQGVGYLRLYSNKVKKHPNAVHGYRMKFYRLKRNAHKNVPLCTRMEFLNAKAEALGIPYRLEVETVVTGYGRPVKNAYIVPVSDCAAD